MTDAYGHLVINSEPDRAKWRQIADVIRERIASGQYGPKFLISEVTLVQELGVARDAVRKTMAHRVMRAWSTPS